MFEDDTESSNEELQETELSASMKGDYAAEESKFITPQPSKMWQMSQELKVLEQMIEQMSSHAEMPHRSHLNSVIGGVHSPASTAEDSSSSLPTSTLQEENDGAPSELEERSAPTELNQSQLVRSALRLRVQSVSSAKKISGRTIPVSFSASSLHPTPTRPSAKFKMVLAEEKPKTASRRTRSIHSKQLSKKSFSLRSKDSSLSVRTSNSRVSEDKYLFHNMDKWTSLLAALTDIPCWEDLSEQSLDSSSGLQLSGDIEGFVKPVSSTGSKFSIQEEEQVEQEEQYSQGDRTMSSSISISYAESNSLLSLIEKVSVKAKAESDEAYEVEMIKNSAIFENKLPSSKSSEAGSGHVLVPGVIEKFLSDLFDQQLGHYMQPSVALKRLLDKEKLHQTIASLHRELKEEISLNSWLDRQTVLCCMRKKQFSYVNKNQHFDLMNYERYCRSLAELGRLMRTEKETISKASSLSAKLAERLECESIASEQKVQDLEETMRSTLLFNENYTHIAEMLQKILADMNKLRNRLAQQRIKLYYSQHRLAHLQIELEQIKNVSEGLNMSTYLFQLDTNNMMETKIIERTAEMNRLCQINTNNIHSLAHLKCKMRMYKQRYKELLDHLRSVQLSQRNYRELRYQGNLKHKNLQREIYRLRSFSTILQYPVLMRDYDETVTKIDTKRAAVAKLRVEYSRLMHHVESAESSLQGDQVEGEETPSNPPPFLLTGISMHSLASMGSVQ